jgi:hypothetical protein
MSEIAQLQPIDTAPRVLAPQASVMTPMAMIDRAIQSGAGIETLERLMALQERWEASEAKREFSEAIAAAKAEIKPIIKNRHAGFDLKGGGRTDYDYEDLAAVADAVDPILTNHGLSYRYQSKVDGMMVSITCILSHRRGHREETTLTAGNDTSGSKNAIQAIGSTVTYLQRYTLKLALGLAATKDSDGATPADDPKVIDAAQFRYLGDLIEQAAADTSKMLVYLKADSLEALTQKQFKTAEAMLRKKISQKEAK